jgi:hypothetical protein
MDTNSVPVPEVTPMPAPAKLMSVRELLRETRSVYQKHLYRFIALILAAFAPGLVLALLGILLFSFVSPLSVGGVIGGIPLGAIVMYLISWGSCVLVKGTALLVKDEPVDIVATYRSTQKRAFPLFVTMLLVGLVIFAGFLLLIIPSIIFGVWYGKSYYVSILEEQKPKASLKKSRAYVRGRFWPVLGRAMVIGILGGIVSLLLQLVLGLLIPSEMIAGVALQVIYMLLWMPFQIIFGYLVYRSLKDTYQEATSEAPSVI